jgi:hypothetical protein
MTDQPLHHGQPKIERNDRNEFDRYEWDDHVTVFRYDDGRIKIGRWGSTVAVVDVSNFAAGDSKGSAHVTIRFEDRPEPGSS